MKYTGKAQNRVTGQEWTTKTYDSYEVAHRAAEKLANKHIPAGNAFIYVVDDSGEAEKGFSDEGGRPRQMTAEETALFIEEQSERLCIEHLGYTPATWYQGGPGHNDDRLEAIITADGDIRVTDGGETQIYSGSRTRPAVRRFVKDWLENLWDEKLEE